MTNDYKNGVRRHIQDTLTHKHFFIQSALKMIEYLYAQDRYEDALELAKRCSMHDHSKLEMDEVEMFIQMPIEEHHDKKPNGRLTEEQRALIEMHWKRNRHHPEFFSDYHKMSEIDILEMVCDWYARSLQFETDFMQFVHDIPQDRFEFDDEFFARVYQYCLILND